MCPEIATPGGCPDFEGKGLDRLLEQVRGLLGEVFDRLEAVAAEAVARRRTVLAKGGVFGVRDVAGLKPVMIEQLTAQPAADGLGFLAAPDLLPDRERHIEWWQRSSRGYVPMRFNLDPTSVDAYDYFDMDWFAAARDHSRRAVFGPYVDYSGADRYVCTLTVPVVDGTFLGVVGADLRMTEFEPRLLDVLRRVGHDAVLVGAERRVVAANTPRWLVGSRLPRIPRPGDGEFIAVGEVGLDSDWVLALAPRE
ncbi:hypothetical protein ABZV31_34820 [Streptomyces sp. NPDC005202]|uniref:PDC sensor domain-containing protein n=1 Tax=Streptomyces sp. NPDC005202 TaxID=3157021 RepID=UPI0033AA4DD5